LKYLITTEAMAISRVRQAQVSDRNELATMWACMVAFQLRLEF